MWTADHWECVGGAWLPKAKLLHTGAETCCLLAVTGLGCLQISVKHGLRNSNMSWALHLTKRCEAEAPFRWWVLCQASTHGPFRLGNLGVWGSGERSQCWKRRIPNQKCSQKAKHQRKPTTNPEQSREDPMDGQGEEVLFKQAPVGQRGEEVCLDIFFCE